MRRYPVGAVRRTVIIATLRFLGVASACVLGVASPEAAQARGSKAEPTSVEPTTPPATREAATREAATPPTRLEPSTPSVGLQALTGASTLRPDAETDLERAATPDAGSLIAPTFAYTTPASPNGLRAVLELQAVFLTGFLYYLSTAGLQHEWDLNYTWEVHQRKLTGQSFGADQNHFGTNFIGHPVGGAGYYQAARGNRLGVYQSFAFAVGGSLLWEYFGEIREVISANDTLVTPVAGLALGESLFQLGAFFDRSSPAWHHRALASLLSPFKAVNDRFDGLTPARVAHGYPDDTWHNFDLQAGLFVVREHASSAFPATTAAEGRIRIETRLARLPDFDDAGHHSLAFANAEASSIQLDLGFSNFGLTNLRLDTQVVLAGRYFRHATRRDSGVWGSGGFIGVGTGYEYSVRDLHRTRSAGMDRISSVQPLQLVMQYQANLGEAKLRSYVDAGPNFAGVTSQVMDEYRGSPDALPNVARMHDYHFGFGGHGTALTSLHWRRLELGSSVRVEAYRGVDAPENVRVSLIDTRASGEAFAGYRIPDSPAAVRLTVEQRRRGSTLDDIHRMQTETSAGLSLAGVF